MKQDKWTQQLHDKLADYETAAPEHLWADIEAALPQQPRSWRSRFVGMRRWAVAAAAATLIVGGSYMWWPTAEEDQPLAWPSELEPMKVAALAPAKAEEAIDTPPEAVVEPEHEPRPQEAAEPEEEVVVVVAEPEGMEVSEETAVAEEKGASEETIIPDAPTAHPVVKERYRRSDEMPVRKARRQLGLNLYAMNSFDSRNCTNGVQLAGELARRYTETYSNSYYAASRKSDPIFLTGYEERQHHYRPFTCGLTLDIPLSSRFSLTTGVAYSKLRSDFTQVMRNQQILQEQTLHYVGIPLNLNCQLWNQHGFKAYLTAGIKADWNVATHLETENVGQELPKDRMQWSCSSSLGVQYDIIPLLGLYAEPGMSWYPDNGSSIQNYYKDKPLSFSLQLGLRLNLKR